MMQTQRSMHSPGTSRAHCADTPCPPHAPPSFHCFSRLVVARILQVCIEHAGGSALEKRGGGRRVKGRSRVSGDTGTMGFAGRVHRGFEGRQDACRRGRGWRRPRQPQRFSVHDGMPAICLLPAFALSCSLTACLHLTASIAVPSVVHVFARRDASAVLSPLCCADS